MPRERAGGGWPYRGFSVRYRRVSEEEATTGPDALWRAEIVAAPELPSLTGPTYATAQRAAERAIDTLIAQGYPTPPPSRCANLRGRYHRIAAYLAALPAVQQESVLSFAALEELLAGPLPITAQTDGQYWRNGTEERVRRWVALGWIACLDRQKRAVIFRRRPQE